VALPEYEYAFWYLLYSGEYMSIQIPLGGSVGVEGSVYVLGNSIVEFPSDANLTLSPSNYTYYLELTSAVALTATRELILPLNPGQTFSITNNTTGGQSITAIGPTGTGVLIAPGGAPTVITTDGINYYKSTGSASGGIALTAPFTYATSSPEVVQAVVPGQLITRAVVVIETAFDDPAASVTVGTTANPDLIFGPGDISTNTTDQYQEQDITPFNANDFLIITITPGTSTQGAGILYYWIQ